MRRARGEVPEVALLDVGDVGPALRVENGDAAVAVGHDGPFGRLMPMQLADAAGGKPHVDAGDFLGDCEIVDRDLSGPAAVLDALGSVVEGSPIHRQAADVGWRWELRRGKLLAEIWIL